MNGDLKTYCQALIKRFVGMQYDGLSGMSIKPEQITSDRGRKALRKSIEKMRSVNIRKKRVLRHSEFQIVQVNVPPVAGSSIAVTAVETFRLEYDSSGESTILVGRRGHNVRMVLGTEGSWVVDDYSFELLDERRENATVMQRAAQTVLMQRSSALSREVPAAYQDPSRSKQLAVLRLKARLRKVAVVVFFLSWVSCVYIWLYGAHSRRIQLDLYTGLKRDTMTVMHHQLWDRTEKTDVSKWVDTLGLPPPKTADGVYWADFGGWTQEMFEAKNRIQPANDQLLAFDAWQTLQVILMKSKLDEAAAVSAYSHYRTLVDEIIRLQEGQPSYTNLAAIKDSLRQMRLDLVGLH